MIEEIKNQKEKNKFEYDYKNIIHLSRVSYNDQHVLFQSFKDLLLDLADFIPEIEEKRRNEKKLP